MREGSGGDAECRCLEVMVKRGTEQSVARMLEQGGTTEYGSMLRTQILDAPWEVLENSIDASGVSAGEGNLRLTVEDKFSLDFYPTFSPCASCFKRQQQSEEKGLRVVILFLT